MREFLFSSGGEGVVTSGVSGLRAMYFEQTGQGFTAVISEPLVSPFKSDLMLARDKSETPSGIRE